MDSFDKISASALTDVLEAVSDLVFASIDGKIRHINSNGVAMLGATCRDDVIGLNFQDFICDDFAASVDNIFDMLAKEPAATPMHIKCLDGTKSSLSINVIRLLDIGEHAYLVTATNITDRVRLSQAIRDSEARFGKLVNSALDFICVMKDGIVTYVNQAGMDLLKASYVDEVIGQSIENFVHDDYKDILGGDLHDLISDGELLPMRFIDISKNPIDVELGIVILEDGDSPRYMIEARDITAHNHAVTALRHSIENLERRVDERTHDLQAEIVERRKVEQQLRHTASHDGLTDLPNRSLLLDRLDQATNRTHRDAKKYAVLFIDLDGFKPINDTLGHDIGDLVLKTVAKRLTSSVRETDTAARIGGDEFILLLTDLDNKESAALVAKKVLRELDKPMHFKDIEAKVGASIGIAFYPDDADTAEGVLKKADDAMYDVKGSGKNSYIMADSD
ncbi:MAG: diguanylate cyclase [Magnetovibrio sp.]|nr:diguanylate cyclase [Magnetovibrio sp.]